MNRILSEEDTATSIVSILLKSQAPTSNNQSERKFYLCVSPHRNHIFEDHVGSDMTQEQFRQLCKVAGEKQHGFVIIDLCCKKHNSKYRSGLDEFYIPNKTLKT